MKYNERFSKWSARKITCVCFNLRWFQYIICWRLKCFWLCNWRLYLLISACYLWSKSLGESWYDWSGINPLFSWLIIARVTQINIRIENLLRSRMNNLSDRNVRRRKQNNPNMHRFKGTELYISPKFYHADVFVNKHRSRKIFRNRQKLVPTICIKFGL